jgi:hypothetical protein
MLAEAWISLPDLRRLIGTDSPHPWLFSGGLDAVRSGGKPSGPPPPFTIIVPLC